MTEMLALPNGYYELPKGKLANVVTCLEMRAKPEISPAVWPEQISLQRFAARDTALFRQIFRSIGEDLMWFSRLIMPEDRLAAILSNPAIESYALVDKGKPVGLLELNFETETECELAFFGLTSETIGKGLGRLLMNEAISRAWAKPISRFWVHTCHYDHPRALGFYKSSGFRPYAVMIEVHDDPRLSGHLPHSASPHVALLP